MFLLLFVTLFSRANSARVVSRQRLHVDRELGTPFKMLRYHVPRAEAKQSEVVLIAGLAFEKDYTLPFR